MATYRVVLSRTKQVWEEASVEVEASTSDEAADFALDAADEADWRTVARLGDRDVPDVEDVELL